MRNVLVALVCSVLVPSVASDRRDGEGKSPNASRHDNTMASDQQKLDSLPAATAVSWAPKMLHGIRSHDFGSVPSGGELKHRFQVTNIYAIPMQITSIRHGCGCVAVSNSHSSGEALAPGAEGWIDVTLDARRFTGHKKVNVYVTFGPHHVDTAAIEITANVQSP